MNVSQEIGLDNLLAAHLDALIAREEAASDAIFRHAPAESRELLHLATQLHAALKPMDPSDEFVKRLRSEFIGDTPLTLLLRWRKLPTRYQTAAKVGGATLTAGLTLLAVRRALTMLSSVRTRGHNAGDPALSLHTGS